MTSRQIRFFLSAVALVVIGLATAAWLLRDTRWAVFFDNAHWSLGYTAAAVGAWWSRSSPGLSPADLRTRFWVALGLSCYAAGQMVWDLQVWSGWNPFPGPSDAPFVLLGPLIVVGLARGWRLHSGGRAGAAVSLDAAAITLGLLVLTLGFYLPNRGEASVLTLIVMLCYPAGLFAAFALALVLVFHSSEVRWGAHLRFSLVLAATSFVWMDWNLRFLEGQLSDGAPGNALFSLLALVLAACTTLWKWPLSSAVVAGRQAYLVLVPMLGVLSAVTGLIVLINDPRHTELAQLVLLGLLLLLSTGALVRQVDLVRTLINAQETAAALNKLRLAQDQLVRAEKLAAMGPLVAGIAHGLNTPLGAIVSASSSGEIAVRWLVADGPQLLAHLTPEDWLPVRLWFDAALATTSTPATAAPRHQRQVLSAELAGLGIAEHEEVAEVFTDLGLGSRTEWLRPHFSNPNLVSMVRLIDRLVTLVRLATVVGVASNKAAAVVGALRNYLHPGGEPAASVLDLGENIEGILPLIHHRLPLGLEFRTEIPRGIDVLGQADRLAQVWINLLNNALHALEQVPQAQKRSLSISLQNLGDKARIEVTDNGPGIPQDLQGKIFTPFFTTKAPGEGTGMGLEVTRSIVLEMGGSITYESTSGRTTFRVELPVVRP